MEGFKLQYWQFIEKVLASKPKYLILFSNEYEIYSLLSASPHLSLTYVRRNIDLPWNWKIISSNPLLKFRDIEKNLDLPWNYLELLKNPDLPWEFIYKNLDKFRDPYYKLDEELTGSFCKYLTDVIVHPVVTMEIIQDHPEIEWNYEKIIDNPNIDFDSYNKFKYAFGDSKKHREKLSKSKNISIQTILDNPDFGWVWTGVMKNPNLVADYIQPLLDLMESRGDILNFSWDEISRSPFITMDMVEKYPDYPWSPYLLTTNPNLTWEFVKRNCDKYFKIKNGVHGAVMCCAGFYWKPISGHPNIKLKDIEENLHDYPWYWSGLSSNPNMTWEFVEKHKSEAWNWSWLSSVIDSDMIAKNYIYRWSPHFLTRNKTLSWDFILKTKDFPWNWKNILLEQEFLKEQQKFVAKKLFDKWKGTRIKMKLIEARECMLWWEHPDNKITIKLRENLWKSGKSICDVYGNS